MDKQMWKQDMVDWLCGFPWLWFTTLTFRPGLKEAQARWRLKKWLGNLGETLGTPDFGYFAVREFGRTGQDLHYHVLIMGLHDAGVEARMEWMRRWEKLAGDPRIDPFNAGPAGPQYILKRTVPDDPDAIIFEMSSHTHMQTSLESEVQVSHLPAEIGGTNVTEEENKNECGN